MESERPWARAAIMREACNREDAPGAERGWLRLARDCGVPAISGVDTRALVMPHPRRRRDARRRVPRGDARAQARELIEAEPPMAGQDLARAGDARATVSSPRRAATRPAHRGDRHRHQGLDGARAARARRARDAAPLHQQRRASCSPRTPTRCSSPTARATRRRSATSCDTVRELVGRKPVWGICLGHQLLCRARRPGDVQAARSATAAPTTRSRTCRPGASRSPPRTTASPRSARAARARSTPTSRCAGRPTSATAQLSHVNLYDRTVEGLELLDVPGGTVQYHPEAGPGPHDSLYLFDRFLERIAQAPDAAARATSTRS